MKLLTESKEKSPRSSMNDTEKASKWLQNSFLGLLDAAVENTDLTEKQISKSIVDIYLKFCKESGIQPYRKLEHCGCDPNE